VVGLLVPVIKNSQMRKGVKMQDDLIEKVEIPKYLFDIINDSVPKELQVLEIVENDEISINYVMNKKIWNQNEVNINETFAYNIVINVMNNNEGQTNDHRRLSTKKLLAKR